MRTVTRIRQWCARYRADIICLIIIVGLATIFMHRWLRPGYTSLPLNLESAILPWHQQVVEPHQNLLISDPFYIFYPARRYLTESLRRGTLPLWNPYIFGGHPVLGDTNTPNYYPFNLLAALLLARRCPTLPAETLRPRLFRHFSLPPGISDREALRYQRANYWAQRYARRLESRFVRKRRLTAMVSELRRFYRLSIRGKQELIERAA